VRYEALRSPIRGTTFRLATAGVLNHCTHRRRHSSVRTVSVSIADRACMQEQPVTPEHHMFRVQIRQNPPPMTDLANLGDWSIHLTVQLTPGNGRIKNKIGSHLDEPTTERMLAFLFPLYSLCSTVRDGTLRHMTRRDGTCGETTSAHG